MTTVDELAIAIVDSEDFMWLMCGGAEHWTQTHIQALRPAYNRYTELRKNDNR